MNIFFEYRCNIVSIIKDFISKGIFKQEVSLSSIVVEPPRDQTLGELATNAALLIANVEKKKPMEVAELISGALINDERVSSVDIAKPGFINFKLKPYVWLEVLGAVFESPSSFGSSDVGRGKKVNVEYISANPTGPLHVGHTRGAVFGDALSNILEFNGYKVTREYYVNDAGSQIDALVRSVYLRYNELFGRKVNLESNSYPGKYLVEVAQDLRATFGDQFLDKDENDWFNEIKKFSVKAMIDLIKKDLELLDIRMDRFYSEQDLYDSGKIDAVLAVLQKKGLIYNGILPAPKGKPIEDYEAKEQTLFRSTNFGDDIDRPIKKAGGGWTYFAPDVAYHFDKIERGYDELIDVLGADHSGYVKRMKAAVNALSNGKIELDVKLCQLVRLFKNGLPYKMSKRSGNFVTLRDMVGEVGKDVVRFLMLTRKNDAPLDFDFDKALEQSKDNAVFYVQYAHARCSSIISKAIEQDVGWYQAKLQDINLSNLSSNEEKKIILKISEWPRVVTLAGQFHEPHRIVSYLYELAGGIHSYQHTGKMNVGSRVLSNNKELMFARLVLISASKSILSKGLKLLGVSPLTKM